MKRLLLPFLFLLVACGGEDTMANQDDGTPIDEESAPEADAEELSENEPEDTYTPENVDGVWQIDDYAEMMLNSKIYRSADDINYDSPTIGYYYSALNLSGGFASVTGAYEGWSEFVIWRMADGNDLLGMMTAGCGPVCSFDFEFHILKDGAYVEKNCEAIVFPWDEMNAHKEFMYEKVKEEYPDTEYLEDYSMKFNLPEKGTSMSVDLLVGAEEVQTKLLELSWDKTKFSISKKYETVENTSMY